MHTQRSVLFLLGGLLAFAMLFGAPAPDVDHAGTLDDPWVLYNSQTVGITWDAYPEGTVIASADCQVAFRIGGATEPIEYTTTYTVTDQALLNDPLKPKLQLYTYVENLANGTYWFRVRVSDVNGNVSTWTAPQVLTKDWKALEPPGGCAIFR